MNVYTQIYFKLSKFLISLEFFTTKNLFYKLILLKTSIEKKNNSLLCKFVLNLITLSFLVLSSFLFFFFFQEKIINGLGHFYKHW